MKTKKKKKKRISVRAAKAKGRNLQQDVRDIFLLHHDEVESQLMGQAGRDIIFRGAAKKLFPFYIECKHWERGTNPHNLIDALTEKAEKENELALIFHRRNYTKPLVTMDVKTFKAFLQAWVLLEDHKKWRPVKNREQARKFLEEPDV